MVSNSAITPTDTYGIKIAIVDDHAMMRECLFSCVTLWGYNVVILACNGRDFLNKLGSDNLPDICILDLNMPEMDGYETLEVLKEAWPDIKVMIFSMNATGRKDKLLERADAILSKADGLIEIKTALRLLSIPNTTSQE